MVPTGLFCVHLPLETVYSHRSLYTVSLSPPLVPPKSQMYWPLTTDAEANWSTAEASVRGAGRVDETGFCS
eukprot:scaffold46031_cov27-Tisochrysis_lutea.AAC.4